MRWPRGKSADSNPPKRDLDSLVAMLNAGHFAQAVSRAQDFARQFPRSAPLLILLGAAHLRARQFQEAADVLASALRLAPRDHAALCNLGIALKEQKRFDEAEQTLRRAIALQPQFFPAYFNLANVLRESGKLNDALPVYQRAIELAPKDAQAHYNLGLTQQNLGRLDQAEASYRRAIEAVPGRPHAQALSNLGNVLLEQNRAEEAVAAHRRAVQLGQGHALAHYNLGRSLEELCVWDQAEAAYRQAISRDPSHVPAQFNLSLLDLRRGRFASGWRGYEWRKRKPDGVPDNTFPMPAWNGTQDLRGKSVFVHSEQGLGDTFQFIRYARMVRDLGAQVIIGAQPALVPMLGSSLADMKVIPVNSVPRQCDYHAAIMSLPLAFGTSLEAVPSPARYLAAEPARAKTWQERLGTHGFRIGICWQGSTLPIDRGRSFPLSAFEGISRIPGVRLISLHKGDGEAQLGDLPAEMRVEVPAGDFDAPGQAFMDTAAVMENCDLVITSDTAVAHLAGAMGRPVWLVLKANADWRWMLEREDSPWYPSMRLFRQASAGDWPGVFTRIAAALTPRVSGQPKGE